MRAPIKHISVAFTVSIERVFKLIFYEEGFS